VSFTPLYLALSPNMKYLLIATDKNMMFVVQVGHSKRLRLLAGGHSCGDYGKPKVSWDSTGKYIYCNSDEGNTVCVYSLASERPVANLRCHKGTVRDVVCHPDNMKRLLITASYDKSVQIWSSKSTL
jgi:WD40 repeat protein